MQSRCLFCPSQEASTAGIRLSLTLTVKILLGSVANATQSKYTAHFRGTRDSRNDGSNLRERKV
jgi:hypothetical protein